MFVILSCYSAFLQHISGIICLIANTFVPVGRNLSQLAEWNARCSSHHGDVFIGKVGREYGLVHTQPVGLGSIWSYFIFVIRKETNTQRQKLMENFGSDLIPYVRYSQASIILLYLTAGLLPVAILFNTLLYIIGPLMLLSVIFFVHTFIAMGYYITPKGVISDENDAEAKVTEARILSSQPLLERTISPSMWCQTERHKA